MQNPHLGASSRAKYYTINVPGVPDNHELGVEEGYYAMPVEDLKAIFDPVVARIVELLRDQVLELQRQKKPVAVCSARAYYPYPEDNR